MGSDAIHDQESVSGNVHGRSRGGVIGPRRGEVIAVGLLAAWLSGAGCVGQVTQGSGSGGASNGSGAGGSTAGSGSGGSGGSNTGSGSGGVSSGGGVGSGGSATGSGGVTTGSGGTGGVTGGSGGSTTVACTSLAAVPRRVWRLSVEQYQASVKDLLGLTTAPALSNRGGQAAFAFFSDSSLGVDENFQFALYQLSEDVLKSIASRITTIAACNSGEAQTACATRFAQTFGAKAFRRPLESTEVSNLMKVYTQGAMQDFNTGISLMIQALIISPSFLYRTELGPATLMADSSGNFPDTTLTPYEIATQLGFLFLGSLPDDALIKAAGDGSLGTSQGLSTQIDRLLGVAAVKQNLTGIVVDWFNVRQLFEKTKDTTYFTVLPTADQDQSLIQADLVTATQQWVSDLLWTKASKVSELATSQMIFVNKRLATLYPGLSYSGSQPTSQTTFVPATFPASQKRIGMLSQPGFLWAASDPAATAIVKRGKLIHDDVVCQDPLPPPIDLSTPASQAVIAMGDSEITKSDARMMNSPCSACHAQMDPYARVLQNFGPVGDYRTMDEVGRAIDPSVTFTAASPLGATTIAGPTEFGAALVSTRVLSDCAVQKMASYAIGVMIRKFNTCELNDLRTQFNQSDQTIASLFRQVAQASFLRARTGGVK